MRTGKELLLATREFTPENRLRSWSEIIFTLFLILNFFAVTLINDIPVAVRVLSSIATGLMYVRMFVIYHDYQHHAILQHSRPARILMQSIGLYLLAPQTIWKRSHDHHHNNNSKLTVSGIGSYPTITAERFKGLSKKEQLVYLINRHPLTILFGYFTLFIYWLNLKSFIQSPSKHWDSFFALLFHLTAGAVLIYFFGMGAFLLTWFVPFLLAFGMGSYLFYCQHNFPKARFCENHDWKYDHAAIASTSFMVMNPFLQWITGNIGYHHIHHMNSRIPFYRLIEAMDRMPELNGVFKTSWNPFEMARCFRLKLWDPDLGKMITLKEFRLPELPTSV